MATDVPHRPLEDPMLNELTQRCPGCFLARHLSHTPTYEANSGMTLMCVCRKCTKGATT